MTRPGSTMEDRDTRMAIGIKWGMLSGVLWTPTRRRLVRKSVVLFEVDVKLPILDLFLKM